MVLEGLISPPTVYCVLLLCLSCFLFGYCILIPLGRSSGVELDTARKLIGAVHLLVLYTNSYVLLLASSVFCFGYYILIPLGRFSDVELDR